MSSVSWAFVRVVTAATVCAASLWAVPGQAVADGPHGIDDLRPAAHTAEPAEAESRLDGRGVQFRPRPDVPELPEVTALSWMVTDLASGKVLAAKDVHRPLPPASTLKTLFALTVLPKFSQGEVHTVSLEDLAGIESGSSLAGLREDMPYQVADLWHGVFLSSGSDAVHTLASMNGGWRKTIDDMQETARRLGARDTRVASADGFDTPGQVSSAYDLTLFGQAGLTNADFAHFASTKRAQLPQDGGPDAFTIQNTNRLLVGSHGVRPYDGLIGVKNGYTTHAGNTLIAAARRDGRTLLVTLMNPQSGGRNAVYEETRALLDWGFEAAPRAAAVGVLPAMERDELTGEPRPVAHRPRPVPLHKAGIAAQTDGVLFTRNWWFLSAAGAVAVIGAAGLGTALWRRRRTARASGSGESGAGSGSGSGSA
ncbi:D-alanyl-D-alanine carboxypeptidase family protein [Streptomyces platensis]|uniref:D-alanyl-D-alanine carboxypeptidase family protein n=1 Tax=Streptomyces platensis TaxID=58346 RepID=UPI002E0F0303|nr:serine hydrolase [Streptomyces platensis]WSI53954.1 D-alanyl-D-alanine carboxypeptidase [Streptomyces platensis]